MQTCKQANKKARVQIVRLLYFADLHGGYKQIGPFRFFVVVPLHRQKTKTRSADLQNSRKAAVELPLSSQMRVRM